MTAKRKDTAPPIGDHLLTLREAAEVLRLSTRTVREYAQRGDIEGRFFGRRVNCEHVPLLPAWLVAWVLDDPRRIPYLLVWRSRSDGTARDTVRIASYSEPPGSLQVDWTGWVEIRRPDGTRSLIRTVTRILPRYGGKTRLLICPYCSIPRRALYGREVDHWGRYSTSARIAPGNAESCAELRYESEDGGLVHRGRGAL